MQDVSYYFQPSVDCQVTISLCASRNTSEPFDTILYLLKGLNGPIVASMACDDDYCGAQSQLSVRPSC